MKKYSLIDQMRRAVVSITSNIAEGFGRNTALEKARFYSISSGSLYELQNQLIIAKDVGYISEAQLEQTLELTVVVNKLINGLTKKVSDRIHAS